MKLRVITSDGVTRNLFANNYWYSISKLFHVLCSPRNHCEFWYSTSLDNLLEKCETSNGDEDVEHKDQFDDIIEDWENPLLHLVILLDALI